LWKTDGTVSGTRILKDINPGTADSVCRGSTGVLQVPHFALFGVGNEVFFSADDGVTRCELWSSDGTPEGTVRHGDIDPNNSAPTGGGYPTEITKINDQVIAFRANDGNQAPGHGTELWFLRRN